MTTRLSNNLPLIKLSMPIYTEKSKSGASFTKPCTTWICRTKFVALCVFSLHFRTLYEEVFLWNWALVCSLCAAKMAEGDFWNDVINQWVTFHNETLTWLEYSITTFTDSSTHRLQITISGNYLFWFVCITSTNYRLMLTPYKVQHNELSD